MLLRSLRNSFRGLSRIINGRTFLIEMSVGLVAIAVTWLWGDFSLFERLIVIAVAFMVLCFEGINTTLERLLDLIEPRYNKKVGDIKDMLGGTVLIGIIGALLVGALIALRVLGVV